MCVGAASHTLPSASPLGPCRSAFRISDHERRSKLLFVVDCRYFIVIRVFCSYSKPQENASNAYHMFSCHEQDQSSHETDYDQSLGINTVCLYLSVGEATPLDAMTFMQCKAPLHISWRAAVNKFISICNPRQDVHVTVTRPHATSRT